MVTFDEKTELAVQEKIIDVTERIQSTSKVLLWLLAVTLVAALPLGLVLRYALFSALYTPAQLILYRPPQPGEIVVAEKKILPAGRDSYFAFARLTNPNADLAVRRLPFEFRLIARDGTVVGSSTGESYLLPGQDRLLYMPTQSLASPPERVEFALKPFSWSRVGGIRNLSFSFQGVSWRMDAAKQLLLSAEVKNENPYLIPRLELTAVLYNIRREIIGVNFTTLQDLRPEEIRFFGLVWPTGVVDPVATVDLRASVNQLISGAVIPLPERAGDEKSR